MRIEVLELSLSHFKCFSSSVNLALKGLPVGLHFVRGVNEVEPALGANGAGKSTLFDALCWALYGKTVEGLRNPDVRPWNSDVVTSVQVDLQRDDKPYSIKRITPNNSLTLNGKTIGQDQIDHELMSFPVFTNTLLLGQGRPLFFDLTPQGKMDLFVDVLDLDRWDTRSQIASDEVKRLSDRETKLVVEIDAANSTLQNLMDLREEARRSHEVWVAERAQQADQLDEHIKSLKRQLSQLVEDKQDVESEADDLRKAIALSEERLEEHTDDLNGLERSYREILVLRNKAEQELKKLASTKGKTCPTCGQSVRQGHLDEHRKELQALVNDPRIGQLSHDVKVAADLVTSTKRIFEQDKRKLEFLGLEIHRHEVLQAKISASLEELERLSSEKIVNPYLAQLRSLRSDIKQQKEDISDLENDLARVRRRAARVKFWVKGFRDCRLYILEEVLDELLLVSNSVCPELGLDGWRIEFEVEKENKSGTIRRGLSVSITSPASDSPVRWESFSGGERQRLRLVGALALSEVLLNHAGIESDFEVLDEPTRHLSAEGIEDLCESLPNRAKRLGRRTFYVDHHAVESVNFSSVLTVRRTREGVSLC